MYIFTCVLTSPPILSAALQNSANCPLIISSKARTNGVVTSKISKINNVIKIKEKHYDKT